MISSGEKTLISVRDAVRGFSTSATGFDGRRWSLRARSMTPWNTVIVFFACAIGEASIRIDVVRRPPLDALSRQILERHIAQVRDDVVAERPRLDSNQRPAD